MCASERSPRASKVNSTLVGGALYDAYLVGCNLLLRLPGHSFRSWVLRRLVRAEIGPDVSIQRGVRITSKGGLRVGAGSNINSGVLLDGRGGLVIGRQVNVSPGALLLTAEHDPASPTFEGRLRAVTIGDRAWIATGAIVLPGASLGDGTVVAAGSVARGTVERNAIIAGNPARVVSRRPEGAQGEIERYRRFLH